MKLIVLAVQGYLPAQDFYTTHADFYFEEDASEGSDKAEAAFLAEHPGAKIRTISCYVLHDGLTMQGGDGKNYTLRIEEKRQ